MNELRCTIEGCTTVFKTEEPISINARYICSKHDRATQVRAAGRVFNPDADFRDAEVKFQDHAFDKFFDRPNRWREDAEIDDNSDNEL